MDVSSAFDVIQTENGLIVFLVIAALVLALIGAVCVFGLEITFKPFSIKKRLPKASAISSKELEKFDIDFLIRIIQDSYQLHRALVAGVQEEYKSKLDISSKKCISTLMNSIILEYIDFLNKNSKTLDTDQHDILELYLEKDINDVILNSLHSFYSEDMTQTEADTVIENSINSIIIDLKTRLLRYRLIKDQSSLKSVYDESPRLIANSLRDAFKTYINYAKEERNEINDLIAKHNAALEEKIRSYIQKGEHNVNNNSGHDLEDENE